MRVALTSQNFRTVTGHAGRARRFIVFETSADAGPVEVARLDLPKELCMHEFRGDGPHPLDGVDVVLSQSFGPGFARRMAARGVTAAVSEHADPAQAVRAYVAAVTPRETASAQETTS